MSILIYSSYFLETKYDLHRFFKNINDFKQIELDLVEDVFDTNDKNYLTETQPLKEFSVYFGSIGRLNKIKFLSNPSSLSTTIIASLSLNKVNIQRITDEFFNVTKNYTWLGQFPAHIYILTTGDTDLRVGYPLLKSLITNLLPKNEKFLKQSLFNKNYSFKKNSFLLVTEFINLIVKRNHLLYVNNPIFFKKVVRQEIGTLRTLFIKLIK